MKLILGLIFIFATGCNYNRSKGPSSEDGLQEKLKSGVVDFAAVKSNVIGPRCVTCHAEYANYPTVKGALEKIKFRTLVARNMPPGGLSRGEGAFLNAWFEQGAPDFVDPNQKPEPDPEPTPVPTPAPTPTPTPSPQNELINFGMVTKAVFDHRCNGCHGVKNPDDDFDMTDYRSVRFKANRIFQRVFVTNDMPEPPFDPVSPEERKILLQWFDQGMPK